MSGVLTSEAAKMNISPVCCRPAAFDANNTQIYFSCEYQYVGGSFYVIAVPNKCRSL